jgi:hypothetical protein
MADCSTSADERRRQIRGSAAWLYLDVPLDERKYDARFSADHPKKGFILDKIAEFRATLKDPSRSVGGTRLARRFIFHLVEDWATESLLAAREAYLIPGT